MRHAEKLARAHCEAAIKQGVNSTSWDEMEPAERVMAISIMAAAIDAVWPMYEFDPTTGVARQVPTQ